MRYGAIDIGTNAARLLVGEVVEEDGHSFIKKVSYTRIPLRLGEEVFSTGEISEKKKTEFVKTIQAFRLISEIFEVVELRACATSAMREATNGLLVRDLIEVETGVSIETISGDEEAELILGTFALFDLDIEVPFVVIDVGGGSTEISIFENGERIASKSFEVGTLRIIKEKVNPNVWADMTEWLKTNIELSKHHIVYGTGGNINKAQKLVGTMQADPISLKKLEDLRDALEPLTIAQRVDRFQLKPDRADVLVPAMEIFSHIMRALKCRTILVPKIGLSDGIIYQLDKKNKNT
ncbi:ethanolamine ammonia-lyase reactivating factor EutA [Crocinitomicaceae bacterium]|nr:ethanolamine ammonia-lyase reactivating factor EutA [Crocinitomicaceae bacterium]MDG1347218.1 ethanolamine ammonia-lyase reactivating factor EutA [Crocinitomicaceae bacterium]MDG2464305.1 ethanolamine ammonia-lyase reactivating factor EutA [Crocinitomicaceae bacterium]